MIKQITTAFIFLIAFSMFGQQEKINNYKYVIVPEKFDFVKHKDQYQTSSLTKFLLAKKGFTVFLSNETLPAELTKNRCLALTANILDNSSMFSVKNKIQFKDCFGTFIFTSKEGKSKEKDYRKGYHEAIRNTFNSMADLKYSYKPLAETSKKKITIDKTVVPVKKVIPVANDKENVKITKEQITKNVLYAQATENGFQLVNTKPEVVFQVLKTKVKDVFIIKNKYGILYKNGTNWVAEFYKNNVLIVENYQIKF